MSRRPQNAIRTRVRRAASGAVTTLSVLLLAGCSADLSDLEEYVESVKARKSDFVEPIPTIKQYEAFAYIPADRRSPFVQQHPEQASAGLATGDGGLRPDPNRHREPLEAFPLDSLRMVGTIDLRGTTFALIAAPDGIVHRIKKGNYMGQNDGEIVEITEAEVKLVELVPDGFGAYMRRPASISISDD